MTRARLSWVLAIPTMLAGVLAAHWVSAMLVPNAVHGDMGSELAERTQPSVLAGIPMWLGAFVAIVIVAGGTTLLRGRGRRVGPLVFVLLPPIAYLVAEVAERGLGTETFPFNPVAEPRMLLGLVLQIPFALLAYLIARLLGRVVRRLSVVLRAVAPVRRPRRPICLGRGEPVRAPRHPALALGYSERGPPRIRSAC